MKEQQEEQQLEEEVTPEQEKQMRILANLILDRIDEDFDNHVLKFQDE